MCVFSAARGIARRVHAELMAVHLFCIAHFLKCGCGKHFALLDLARKHTCRGERRSSSQYTCDLGSSVVCGNDVLCNRLSVAVLDISAFLADIIRLVPSCPFADGKKMKGHAQESVAEADAGKDG